MYNYNLINNHYIVNIDGKQFLIDTGWPSSFWVSSPIREIIINKITYQIENRPSNFNVVDATNLIGVEVDGFIGLDIISKTGLTIYKNGTIDFAIKEIDGIETPMTNQFPLMADIECNSMIGKYIIDTGAKYGYGVNSLFYQQQPYSHVTDYSPSLGHLESDIYHLHVVIGGHNKIIDVCNNTKVANVFLKSHNAIMIGSISSLFEEACILDTNNGRLILK